MIRPCGRLTYSSGPLAELLRIDRHEVTVARSGKDALARLAEQDYGAIICDLRMPEMDGPELYAALARDRPALLPRFIFTTGDVLGEPSRRFLENLRATLPGEALPARAAAPADRADRRAGGVGSGARRRLRARLRAGARR